jgi:two-component system chemotaxis response regulator CheY
MGIKIIAKSAEHNFLTVLEKIKRDPTGWIGMWFALSRDLIHDDMIENPAEIAKKISKIEQYSEKTLKNLDKSLQKSNLNGSLYQFSDGDIILLARITNNDQRTLLKTLFDTTSNEIGSQFCEYHNLNRDIYLYQKLADQKMISGKLVRAYQDMADFNKLESLSLRRKRREDPIILFVEDDRFTSTYAANILSDNFEVIQAKTGEEAISAYIEHAPDMSFLDIHLPGISGHDTLKAIRKIDPEAYIVMLSVDAVRTNIVNASDFGASDFLKKPFSRDRLLLKAQKSPFIKADVIFPVAET